MTEVYLTFRELDSIGDFLDSYGDRLVSKTKKGEKRLKAIGES